uniref:Uncharacterized protein n=1 Tax=Rhizophora mucronata TaxID=61149 RepID=A0A2P2Q8E6_RHIMU
MSKIKCENKNQVSLE